MRPRVAVVACEHARCRGKVFPARIMKNRGAPTDVILDAVPSTWEEGARIKLNGMQVTGFELATKLTASQISRAFAVREMYVPHAERCGAAQKKAGAKKGDGHA